MEPIHIINELHDTLEDTYVISYVYSDKSVITIPCNINNNRDNVSIWWGNEKYVCYLVNCRSFTFYERDDMDGIISFLNKHNCHLLGGNIKKAN